MGGSPRLVLTKHHGAGNDFLVHLDVSGERAFSPAEATALCDRHRGVGADGLLRATRSNGVLTMELHNADGSSAEMSGNGVRCLVQAAVDGGWASPGTVEVDTAAGRRRVHYEAGPGAGEGYARVDMGAVVLGADLVLDEPPGLRAARAVDVGNPHLVLLLDGPPSDDVVEGTGARLSGSVPGEANVEFVWRTDDPGVLAMRVFERGVGQTLACGTGTCAAAAAARAWGIAGGSVSVRNPGGTLEVELRDDGGATLGGPTVSVARLEVAEDVLAALVADAAGSEVTATR